MKPRVDFYLTTNVVGGILVHKDMFLRQRIWNQDNSGILEFHHYKSPATELLAKYLDFAASIIHCYCGVFATEKTLKAINKVAATKQQTSDKYYNNWQLIVVNMYYVIDIVHMYNNVT